jgi:hypothetical protein
MKIKTPSSSLGTSHVNVCDDKTYCSANQTADDAESKRHRLIGQQTKNCTNKGDRHKGESKERLETYVEGHSGRDNNVMEEVGHGTHRVRAAGSRMTLEDSFTQLVNKGFTNRFQSACPSNCAENLATFLNTRFSSGNRSEAFQ